MRLTRHSDYSLRVLMYVGLKAGELSTIKEIGACYAISYNHLMKVVYRLGQLGYLETLRGKHGGLRLARPPAEINLGQVVRQTEHDLALVECFTPANSCRIVGACGLKTILGEALVAFLAVLDRYTLADLLCRPAELAAILMPEPPDPARRTSPGRELRRHTTP